MAGIWPTPLLLTAQGKSGGYEIKDEAKLKALATEYGIAVDGRSKAERLPWTWPRQSTPNSASRKDLCSSPVGHPSNGWPSGRKWASTPRGIDREIVEIMHRTHIGVDNDPVNLILQGLKASIADGWGGSTIATEISDVLFGTPTPVRSEANLGVLKADQVNIVAHGHEPVLSEMILAAAADPTLVAKAKTGGAKGINVVGMCCTGNEISMRHGIPMAGNFLQQELAVITGAVDAMIVDVQCIMPSLGDLCSCFHTRFISTSPKAKFPGAVHMEFHEEKALETAKQIVAAAVENYSNRVPQKVFIPEEKTACMVGFSTEAIVHALGGTLDPLLDAIKSGAVQGNCRGRGLQQPEIQT